MNTPIHQPKAPDPRERLKLLAPALIYAAVILILYALTRTNPANNGRGHDGRFYAAMADDQTQPEPFIPIAPYCYRVLTPALVGCLPGPVVQRFRRFDLVVWLAALLAWHLLARRTGLSPWQATFGGLLLASCAWGPMSAFYNPCYVDPLMYLLIFIGLNLILTGRTAWLAVLLPIAMLQREQCLILWVAAVAHEAQHKGWSKRLLARYGAMLAACGAVYLSLRLAIPPLLETTPPTPLVVVAVVRWLMSDPEYLLKSLLGVLYALGVPLLGFALLPGVRQYVRDHHWVRYYLLLAALSLLGGSDKARLVFLAQPVLILAFLHGLGPRLARARFRFAAGAILLVHLYVQFPPTLMAVNGRLDAPLVDSVERGTHGANLYEPGLAPVSMTAVTTHLAFSLTLAALLLLAWRFDKTKPDRVGRALPPAALCIRP